MIDIAWVLIYFDNIEIIQMKCCICHFDETQSISFKEMMFGFLDEFKYVRCNRCGCVYIQEPPQNISKYYPDSYYSFKKTKGSPLINFIKRARNRWIVFNEGFCGFLISKRFPDPILFLLRKLNMRRTDLVLDIGCGSGDLLYSLHDMGFSNLVGIDLYNVEPETQTKGLLILKQSIFDMDNEKKFDFIMMHHSFEHMSNQKEVLMCIKKILAPNGVLLVRIPLSDSWAFQEYKENWVQIDAPRHFFLHTRKSLQLLANEVGFFIDDVVYDSTEFQFVGSMGYQRGIPLVQQKENLVLSKEDLKKYKEQAKLFNKNGVGDQACFYLKLK